MGKKDFEWVRDAEEPVTASPARRSRREKKKPAGDADGFAEILVAMTPSQLAAMPISEESRAEVRAMHAIKSGAHGAKRRQLLRLGSILRGEDHEAIEEALGGGSGTTARDADLEQIVRWRARMVEEGDDAIQAFLEVYPAGNRQRIRQLANQVRKTGNARTNKQLMTELKIAARL
jgi:ribosome-associated protein